LYHQLSSYYLICVYQHTQEYLLNIPPHHQRNNDSVPHHFDGLQHLAVGHFLQPAALFWHDRKWCVVYLPPYEEILTLVFVPFLLIVYKKGATQCGPIIPCSPSQKIHSLINTLMNFLVPLIIMSFCNFKISRAVTKHIERYAGFIRHLKFYFLSKMLNNPEQLLIFYLRFILKNLAVERYAILLGPKGELFE
jgi:hypothetical protein